MNLRCTDYFEEVLDVPLLYRNSFPIGVIFRAIGFRPSFSYVSHPRI